MRTTLPLLLVLAACSHSEPFTAPDEPLDGPFSPGVPVRLTYADGAPSAPVWTNDGDSVLYSYTRRGGGFLVQEERCLAVLPAAGGTIRREICSRSVFPTQSADVFDLPALSAGGQLAFYHDGQPAAGGAAEALLLAPFATPSAYTVLRSFPFQSDVFYVGLTFPRWVDETRIVGVGIAEEQVPRACPGCQPILIRYGHSILIGEATTPGVMVPLPGTELATSVAPGETSDLIYFTLGNDSRIYRRSLATGETVVVHDFGAPAIARDVHFAAGKLVAVVGGSVLLHTDALGTLQSQNLGGNLHVVTPGGAAAVVSTAQPMWFRRPALSPDGTGIVAEGATLQINAIGDGAGTIIGYDTIPGPSAIWRIAAP